MADIDEDDEFGSDDAFDDLPPNTLLQLEQQASQFAQSRRPPPIYNGKIAPYANHNSWQAQNQESFQSDKTIQPHNRDEQYSYNDDDEDIIDLDQDPYAIQQPYNQGHTLAGRLQKEAQAVHPANNNHDVHATHASPTDQASVTEMQARIIQLEKDRSALQKQVDEARSHAQSKAGEAAILRQKAEKAAKDHEYKVASLRQLHAEEYAKQKAELDRVRNDREKLTTDNRFLEHDLALEAGKTRQFQRTQKGDVAERSKSSQRISPAVTPKRSKVLPYRDGFDDSDLVMLSPSKHRDRSKPITPKAGTKRKRMGNDVQSPIAPPQLPLSEPKPAPLPSLARADAKVAADLLQRLAREQSKLRFMQKLLQHCVNEEAEENVLEALTRFAFPSNPNRKLSSILYEKLSMPSLSGNTKNVSEQCCEILLSLWERSLVESYYPPIPCLVSSMRRILDLERFSFMRRYIARVVPLAIATSDLVAIPLARASLNKNQSPRTLASHATTAKPAPQTSGEIAQSETANSARQSDEAAAVQCIDVVACLELLRALTDVAMPNRDAITEFWQHMKFDFVLLILMRTQPVAQMAIMLDLLRTSALAGTFGAITDGQRDRQERREVDTLDRLTVMLGEKFEMEQEDADATAVFELREKVVAVLLALVFKDHGALLLAAHRYAVGRLFKFLHDSINYLYLYTHPSDHDPIVRSINNAMKVLYLLCSSTGSAQVKVNVDIRQKLSVVPGGMHVHLLALTRLAFAERIWYERGIEEGTMERAHEMLDEWLSPEEGEGLMMMFGSEGSGDMEMQ